jgi:nucleoside phosphorylase
MRRLILRSRQSPGDILMLTAAVRDLHTAHPQQFETDVRTSAEAIWDQNPRVTKLSERDRDVEVLDMHYPLVHESNQKPFHFTHGSGAKSSCTTRNGNRRCRDRSYPPSSGS